MTKEEFLEKCCEIHKDRYDYSFVEYKNISTKVEIICNSCHHRWFVRPLHHVGKPQSGCPKCANKSRSLLKTRSLESFIEDANKIHSGKYNYTLSKYVKNHIKIDIICPEHGLFQQSPSSHLKGFGCKFCSGYKLSNRQEKEYTLYKKKVWSVTNKSYRKYMHIINPGKLPRNREYHLDHKFSIFDGYQLGILPDHIGDYRNLQIISAKENRNKWHSSCIDENQLFSILGI